MAFLRLIDATPENKISSDKSGEDATSEEENYENGGNDEPIGKYERKPEELVENKGNKDIMKRNEEEDQNLDDEAVLEY